MSSLPFLHCFHVLSLSGAHTAVVQEQHFLMLPIYSNMCLRSASLTNMAFPKDHTCITAKQTKILVFFLWLFDTNTFECNFFVEEKERRNNL